jgi:hypothetical protein
MDEILLRFAGWTLDLDEVLSVYIATNCVDMHLAMVCRYFEE